MRGLIRRWLNITIFEDYYHVEHDRIIKRLEALENPKPTKKVSKKK